MSLFPVIALFWGAVISGEFKSTNPIAVAYNFRKDGAVIVKVKHQGKEMAVEGKWEEVPSDKIRKIHEDVSKDASSALAGIPRLSDLLKSSKVISLSFGDGHVLTDFIYQVEGGDWKFFKTGFRLIDP